MTDYLPPLIYNPNYFNPNEFPEQTLPSADEITYYDTRYVKKTGDTMSGTLTEQQNLSVAGTLTINNPITIGTYVYATSQSQLGYNWNGSAGTNLTSGTITPCIYYYGGLPMATAGIYLFQGTVKMTNTGGVSSTMTRLRYGVSNNSSFGFTNADESLIDSVTIATTDTPTYNINYLSYISAGSYIFLNVQATYTGSTLRAECFGSMTRIA